MGNGLPITLTGLAAIVAASICLLQAGLRKCILNPYLLVCLSYFRFFGLPLDDPEYAFVVDLAHLLAFVCFSVAFFHAMSGRCPGMRRFLRCIWPPLHDARTKIPPLSYRTVILLALIALSYAAFDLWLNSLIYGGLDRALLRSPESDVSPWLARMSIWLSRVSVVVVFVLRLNYTLYRRGRLAMWLALLASLAIAFPTGSAGKFISPVSLCVIADILAALHRNRSLRPRLDMVALCTLAVCGGMLLHVIRETTFENISQVVEVVGQDKQAMPDRLFSAAGRSHSMVSEDTAFCMRTFGRSEDFLPGHSLYTIVVNPIPREMWPAKPIAFGRILGQIRQRLYGSPRATAQGWSIAAGLAGEGYANGGYFGIILLCLLIGYLCGKGAKAAMTGFFMPSYPILIISLGLYKFSSTFVRGDVHSAWTQTVYPLLMLSFAFMTWARISNSVRVICLRSPYPKGKESQLVCPHG